MEELLESSVVATTVVETVVRGTNEVDNAEIVVD
jgi:hypothetical protein